ncbi:MAG TPA: pyrroline-5-carboxylate reductase [Rhodospirillaceae bacterium]|nr:pyrroline-5-carboxylate reductase [Candidatus Neomarinimicrobiota bacterium]HCX15036.1 pyrroline-5-carboxylate reductase [Rhodospirillaceae bacterium]
MQSQKRIFDDLAHVAGSALGAISGLKQEIEVLVRDRVERLMASSNFVRRDEFDAVKEMAATARAEQERLKERVEELGLALSAKSSRAPSKSKSKGST